MKIKGYVPDTLEAARGWLLEEMGELAQAIGKDMRFPKGSYPDGKSNNQAIWEEIRDVYEALAGFAEFHRRTHAS